MSSILALRRVPIPLAKAGGHYLSSHLSCTAHVENPQIKSPLGVFGAIGPSLSVFSKSDQADFDPWHKHHGRCKLQRERSLPRGFSSEHGGAHAYEKTIPSSFMNRFNSPSLPPNLSLNSDGVADCERAWAQSSCCLVTFLQLFEKRLWE